jgi:hypothetical protein
MAVLLTLCVPACRSAPSIDYTGVLTLTYARTFPAFTATVAIDVDVYRSGDVLFSQPEQVAYAGESQRDGEIKLKEAGTITITSLAGAWVLRGGVEYLEVTCATLIDGTQTVWGWDDDMGWVQVAEIPFTVEDPAKPPLRFDSAAATIGSGATIGVTNAAAFGGTQTFQWTLVLLPLP